MMEKTGKNGLANADITVLVPNHDSGQCIVKSLKKDNIRTAHTFGKNHRRLKMGFYMSDARVKITTIDSFKGWESRFLVVCVKDVKKSQNLNAMIYVALTRLKRSKHGSWLTVICSVPMFEKFARQCFKNKA